MTTLDCYAHLWPDSEDVTRRALDAGLLSVMAAPELLTSTGSL